MKLMSRVRRRSMSRSVAAVCGASVPYVCSNESRVEISTLDSFEHTYGTEAPQTAATLRDIDRLLTRLISFIDSQKVPDTYLAVVSDHGYVDVDRAVGPNTLFKQEGLIATDERGAIRQWQVISHGTGGSALVYMKGSNAALLTR